MLPSHCVTRLALSPRHGHSGPVTQWDWNTMGRAFNRLCFSPLPSGAARAKLAVCTGTVSDRPRKSSGYISLDLKDKSSKHSVKVFFVPARAGAMGTFLRGARVQFFLGFTQENGYEAYEVRMHREYLPRVLVAPFCPVMVDGCVFSFFFFASSLFASALYFLSVLSWLRFNYKCLPVYPLFLRCLFVCLVCVCFVVAFCFWCPP